MNPPITTTATMMTISSTIIAAAPRIAPSVFQNPSCAIRDHEKDEEEEGHSLG
jgi:hypothetical protein